jgi:hypothetical protein
MDFSNQYEAIDSAIKTIDENLDQLQSAADFAILVSRIQSWTKKIDEINEASRSALEPMVREAGVQETLKVTRLHAGGHAVDLITPRAENANPKETISALNEFKIPIKDGCDEEVVQKPNTAKLQQLVLDKRLPADRFNKLFEKKPYIKVV